MGIEYMKTNASAQRMRIEHQQNIAEVYYREHPDSLVPSFEKELREMGFRREELRTHFVRFVNSKHSGCRKYAKVALKKLEKTVVYSMFFVMIMQLCACGDIDKEPVSTVFNESKQYYEAPSETKLYKYSDFDWVVLGETTIMELYETVGESQGCLLLNLHMDYIYPLENGKYLSVECWYYDMENGDTDYTVDKMILLDTNPLQS